MGQHYRKLIAKEKSISAGVESVLTMRKTLMHMYNGNIHPGCVVGQCGLKKRKVKASGYRARKFVLHAAHCGATFAESMRVGTSITAGSITVGTVRMRSGRCTSTGLTSIIYHFALNRNAPSVATHLAKSVGTETMW